VRARKVLFLKKGRWRHIKTLIFKNKTYKQLPKMVSSEYREIIPGTDGCVSGLVFPDKVIHS